MPPFKTTRCYQQAISGVNWLCSQWFILNDLRRDLQGSESIERGGEKYTLGKKGLSQEGGCAADLSRPDLVGLFLLRGKSCIILEER